MKNLCEATASSRGIHFDSSQQQAALDFVHEFDRTLNGLKVQPDDGGFVVRGSVTCLGLRHAADADVNTAKSENFPCLRVLLESKGFSGQLNFEGSCVQEMVPKQDPVDHEGFLLDLDALTIRDHHGVVHTVRQGDMALFRVLSHEAQTYDQIILTYNKQLDEDKRVGRDTVFLYLRHLELELGTEVIQREYGRQVKLVSGGQEPNTPPVKKNIQKENKSGDPHPFDATRAVPHAGFLLDFENSTMRDAQGEVKRLPTASLQLFSILNDAAQSWEQVLAKFNTLRMIDAEYEKLSLEAGYGRLNGSLRFINMQTLRAHLSELERCIGPGVVLRQANKLVLKKSEG